MSLQLIRRHNMKIFIGRPVAAMISASADTLRSDRGDREEAYFKLPLHPTGGEGWGEGGQKKMNLYLSKVSGS
jgi:hypothetical protein